MEGEDEIEEDENVLYTKADSRRLERYLQQEAMSEWRRPEKKCAQHSVRCEVCELLSKDTSNKELEIISRTWDAGRKVIRKAFKQGSLPILDL